MPPAGVAPGIAARAGQTRIFAYPGVPYEFQQMWRESAAALERDGFFPDVAVRMVRVFGVGELQVGPVLDAVPHDLVELGINVGGGEVTVRVRHRREPAAQAQADALVAALEAGVPVYSTDGRTVDDIVADELRGRGLTARGGRVVHRRHARLPHHRPAGQLRLLPRRRDQLRNQAKMDLLHVPPGMLAQYGAVSEEVAGAMADGRQGGAARRLRALGHRRRRAPTAARADKPVGLVYLGCAGPAGTNVRRRRSFPGDRDTVRTFSATTALHLLRAGRSRA